MEMKINLNNIFSKVKTQETVLQTNSDDNHLQTIQSTKGEYENYFLQTDIFTQKEEKVKVNKKESEKQRQEQIFQHNKYFSGKEKSSGSMLFLHKINQHQNKVHFQRIRQNNKNITFKPDLNQKSLKIAEKKRKYQKKIKKNNTQLLSTQEKKNQQQLKQCTFQPSLVSKSLKYPQKRQKDKVHENLYDMRKIKEQKLSFSHKMKEQEEAIKNVKIKQKQFEIFLQRNSDFILKVSKIKNTESKKFNTNKKYTTPLTKTPKSQFTRSEVSLRNFQPRNIFQKCNQQ